MLNDVKYVKHEQYESDVAVQLFPTYYVTTDHVLLQNMVIG